MTTTACTLEEFAVRHGISASFTAHRPERPDADRQWTVELSRPGRGLYRFPMSSGSAVEQLDITDVLIGIRTAVSIIEQLETGGQRVHDVIPNSGFGRRRRDGSVDRAEITTRINPQALDAFMDEFGWDTTDPDERRKATKTLRGQYAHQSMMRTFLSDALIDELMDCEEA